MSEAFGPPADEQMDRENCTLRVENTALRAQIVERDALIAALREALERIAALGDRVADAPGGEWTQRAVEAWCSACTIAVDTLAATPAAALDALKREWAKRGAAWQREHSKAIIDMTSFPVTVHTCPSDDDLTALLAEARHE